MIGVASGEPRVRRLTQGYRALGNTDAAGSYADLAEIHRAGETAMHTCPKASCIKQ